MILPLGFRLYQREGGFDVSVPCACLAVVSRHVPCKVSWNLNECTLCLWSRCVCVRVCVCMCVCVTKLSWSVCPLIRNLS